jgi:hypothetical protein
MGILPGDTSAKLNIWTNPENQRITEAHTASTVTNTQRTEQETNS